MLIIKAKLTFHKKDGLTHDLNTKNILRTSFTFGKQLGFTGDIKANKNDKYLKLGEEYIVLLEFPTIKEEDYEEIKDLIYEDSKFEMYAGSRTLGTGTVIEYLYIE